MLVRSFARIHEANLKKQGILPLTFADPEDYEKVRFDDTVDVVGLSNWSSIVTVNGWVAEALAVATKADDVIASRAGGPAITVNVALGSLPFEPIAYTVWLPRLSPGGIGTDAVVVVPPELGTVSVARLLPALHGAALWSRQ